MACRLASAAVVGKGRRVPEDRSRMLAPSGNEKE